MPPAARARSAAGGHRHVGTSRSGTVRLLVVPAPRAHLATGQATDGSVVLAAPAMGLSKAYLLAYNLALALAWCAHQDTLTQLHLPGATSATRPHRHLAHSAASGLAPALGLNDVAETLRLTVRARSGVLYLACESLLAGGPATTYAATHTVLSYAQARAQQQAAGGPPPAATPHVCPTCAAQRHCGPA